MSYRRPLVGNYSLSGVHQDLALQIRPIFPIRFGNGSFGPVRVLIKRPSNSVGHLPQEMGLCGVLLDLGKVRLYFRMVAKCISPESMKTITTPIFSFTMMSSFTTQMAHIRSMGIQGRFFHRQIFTLPLRRQNRLLLSAILDIKTNAN